MALTDFWNGDWSQNRIGRDEIMLFRFLCVANPNTVALHLCDSITTFNFDFLQVFQ
jgi:hypothetical protein